ncbi:MAG: bifunctional (p)ppGpp synthetase/guanosine-3',5'-bis(diphosphate) 3'-pyrophosphohydrolase [Marinilabiliaceae bacterium]|nr:bifunctional (p)ppGpp synthetase/guanosine-3',5'-bis(diphosphate) 3'-pyrophosphohydrolase [Marinilabiliaceae bacterium]
MSMWNLSPEEEDLFIQDKFNDLVSACPRCQDKASLKLIEKAFKLALEAHSGIKRKSGEPFILHPIEVARIAGAEMGLGSKGVAAALLHDVVEDTEYTVEDIKTIFGEKIGSIVDGLTKLSGVLDKDKSKQVENFRKLLLSMIEDIRVILIKLADRLHNMRTLDSMAENKRLKIAAETIFFYAPLAHRLGLYTIKSELEDLSLKHEHPGIYNELYEKVKANEEKHQNLINHFSLPIIEKLSKEGYIFDIKGRPKSIYSIYSKMQKKNIPFEEIYDILAIRIVFHPKNRIPEKAQCWAIYSLITDIYKPKPDRLRDWVSTPKANGYEALHATVMGPQGKWVEIQIRSERMDEIAELGFASHYKYKGNQDKESELDSWLKQIRDILEDPDSSSLEFLDDFKLNVFSSEMLIFTPKGDNKVMPKGSTALDLAFEIHTDIGYKSIGAKVNYKLVPLSYQLQSGDQVEIITSEKQTPKYEWLDFVTTPNAKNKIKRAFKKERKDLISKGEQILETELNKSKLTTNSRIIRKLLNYYNLPAKNDLTFKIGIEQIQLDNLSRILSDKTSNKWVKYWKLNFGKNITKRKIQEKNSEQKHYILSDSDNSQNFSIATCCNPIPGDDVVGYLDDEKRIILHSRKCPIAIKLMSSEGNQIVSAQWESHKILSYLAIINLSGIDQVGMVSKITKIISDDQNVNMRSLNFESHDGIFEGKIYLYIHNANDLNKLILRLVKIKGIHSVIREERIKG